ncbi:ribbon-helix-helix domain-containing protein [Nodosilinea sp. AN01ver1]|uniref:ribbon-helix-helix domain-containing protein n=1 Tax=Nodosilinea sp. AN01ver1 TaxID=3423362 RepID=UPI003D32344C
MSKRYNITLPDGIAQVLEHWAQIENNKPSTLAAFLVERAVRETMEQGKVPQPWEIEGIDAQKQGLE